MKELDKVLISLHKKNLPNHMKDKIKYTSDIKLKKVAFDVYKIDNGESMKQHYDNLWALEEHNGSPYLVRVSDPKFSTNYRDDNWSVSSAYDNTNIVLAYKNVPIANFSSTEFGYNEENITIFKQAVLDKVLDDNEFAQDVFSMQSMDKVSALQETFPELKKYIKG